MALSFLGVDFIGADQIGRYITRTKMRKMLPVLLIALAVNAQAAAGFYTGNEFLDLAPPRQISYVMGVVDALVMTKIATPFCMPGGVTGAQVTAIAKKYFDDNPKERHTTAASNIAVALHDAFPCK